MKTIKKLIAIVAIIAISFTFTSCEKETNEPSNPIITAPIKDTLSGVYNVLVQSDNGTIVPPGYDTGYANITNVVDTVKYISPNTYSSTMFDDYGLRLGRFTWTVEDKKIYWPMTTGYDPFKNDPSLAGAAIYSWYQDEPSLLYTDDNSVHFFVHVSCNGTISSTALRYWKIK